MAPLRLAKSWRPFTEAEINTLAGHLGIFQLADAGKNVIYIGMAGGRSLFGLKSRLSEAYATHSGVADYFRIEVNTQYLTRYKELLMLHAADYGEYPALNITEGLPGLGRLSPIPIGT